VLDTRDLGRRPGAERTVSFTAPAPVDLGIEVLGVPEGSPVTFELRLESVVEGVLVTGRAHAELTGECVRCLDDIRRGMDADLCELFVYDDPDRHEHHNKHDKHDKHRTEGDADPEDGETSRMHGDLLDLEPLLRDAVVLALPFQPTCTEDCPGLCVECGARLADDAGHTHDAAVDPRWAALQQLSTPQDS
jgi:uncharacterized protein